jgi:hypothetical protein
MAETKTCPSFSAAADHVRVQFRPISQCQKEKTTHTSVLQAAYGWQTLPNQKASTSCAPHCLSTLPLKKRHHRPGIGNRSVQFGIVPFILGGWEPFGTLFFWDTAPLCDSIRCAGIPALFFPSPLSYNS